MYLYIYTHACFFIQAYLCVYSVQWTPKPVLLCKAAIDGVFLFRIGTPRLRKVSSRMILFEALEGNLGSIEDVVCASILKPWSTLPYRD